MDRELRARCRCWALAERGYKGKLYGTPAIVNADFIRVGGKAVEGILASGGPVLVADQLPDTHYAKKLSLAFRAAHLKANGVASTDSFAPYAFDAWLIFADAAARAKAKAAPGTPEFHAALRDALFSVKELAGTQGVYTFTAASGYGTDEREPRAGPAGERRLAVRAVILEGAIPGRHVIASAAKQPRGHIRRPLGCFVASLLAMTGR